MGEVKEIKMVGAIILNDRNGVMLQLRDDPQFAGQWSTFGGYVEEGDKTVDDAIKREIQEEIGCEIDLKFFSKYIILEGNLKLVNYFFYGYIDDHTDINLKEGKGFGFFSIDQIKDMKLILNSDYVLFRFFKKVLNFEDLKWEEFKQGFALSNTPQDIS